MSARNKLEFGIAAPQIHGRFPLELNEIHNYIRRVEELAFHSIWVQEQARLRASAGALEGISLLSYVAALTQRIRSPLPSGSIWRWTWIGSGPGEGCGNGSAPTMGVERWPTRWLCGATRRNAWSDWERPSTLGRVLSSSTRYLISENSLRSWPRRSFLKSLAGDPRHPSSREMLIDQLNHLVRSPFWLRSLWVLSRSMMGTPLTHRMATP